MPPKGKGKKKGPAAARKAKQPKRKGKGKGKGGGSSGFNWKTSAVSMMTKYLAPAISPFAGKIASTIIGSGDYKISKNTLSVGPMPSFGNANVRIKYREFLGNIVSGPVTSGVSDFTAAQFPLNPGQRSTFPWLSQFALNYEKYRFHGLVFNYVSTSGNALNSTNTALGQVLIATDYDVLDASFTDERQMMATLFSNYGVPSNNLLHAVECAPKTTATEWFFVRSGEPQSSEDQRLDDLGRTTVATSGLQAANVTVGGLWVAYDVEFSNPSIIASGVADGSSGIIQFKSTGTTSPFSSVIYTNGTNPPAVYAFSTSQASLSIPNAIAGSTWLMWINLNFTPSGSIGVSPLSPINLLDLNQAGGTAVAILDYVTDTAYPTSDFIVTVPGTYTTSSKVVVVVALLDGSAPLWPWSSIPAPMPPLISRALSVFQDADDKLEEKVDASASSAVVAGRSESVSSIQLPLVLPSRPPRVSSCLVRRSAAIRRRR